MMTQDIVLIISVVIVVTLIVGEIRRHILDELDHQEWVKAEKRSKKVTKGE